MVRQTESKESMQRRQRTKALRKTRRRMIGAVASCVVGVGILVIAAAYYGLRPPRGNGEARFDVARGESSSDVAQNLQRVGLIRSAFWFRTYMSWTGASRHIQAGHYQLPIGSSPSAIAYVLVGGVVADETVTVTIPEGFTALQIADRLAKDGVCSATEFIKAEQNDTFTEPFVKERRAQNGVKYRLEGYLFPDTYQFVRNEPAHRVIDLMLQDFGRRASSVTQAAKANGVSLNRLVTIASLIEREAKVADERPVIASVIDNRLKRGMKLQIDATIEYILGHRDVLTDSDLAVNDPYNTYLHAGLPPGPIANPGLASLQAAIHPAATPYLYYVVKNDGTGRDYFARTYAEQLRNIARSQANLRTYSKPSG